MARNGSGNYTKVNTFTAGTPITAASHNQNWDDVAAEITNSVAADGQTTMTGPLKAASGAAVAPSYSFGSDPDTGMYRRGTNELGFSTAGVEAGYFDAAKKFWMAGAADVAGALSVTGTLSVGGSAAFPVPSAQIADLAVTPVKMARTTASRLLGTGSVASTAISGAANNGSGLVRLTVGSATGYVTGAREIVTGIVGTTEANGSWLITVIDGTHVDLQGSAYANAYVSGGTFGGGITEIVPGTGLSLNDKTLTAAFPPSGAFKSLVIKVTGNTGLTAAADYVTTTDGTAFQTTALSSTINMASTGANALDTGSIASATWYAIWAIAKSDGTTAGLASTSFTSPTMPSGYTYKARIGAVRTTSGVAQLLGTWQIGRRAQYVVGLANTTTLPVLASGSSGSTTTPTWTSVSVANFVPTTAGAIRFTGYYSANTLMAAPNNSYGASTSTTNVPPLLISLGGSLPTSVYQEFILESANIYYASNGNNNALFCFGWEDTI